jgi:hypothetical protein
MKPTPVYNVVNDPAKQAHAILTKFGNGVKGGLVGFVSNSAGRVALRLAGQTWPATKASGDGAILRDVNRAWRPVGILIQQAKNRDKNAGNIINALVKSGKVAEANAYLRKLGLNITISDDLDPKQHQENRNPKTGVARKTPARDVLVFNRDRLTSYAALVPQPRVGNAAHGWMQASRAVRKRRSSDVLAVGNTVNVNRIPPFKDKPADVTGVNGSALLSGPPDNPVVTITNSFPGIRRVMKSQALSFALQGEAEILRKQIHAAAASNAKRLGLTTYAV